MVPQTPEEERSERGFTVADKRLFNKTGERRSTAEQPDAPSSPPPPTPPPAADMPPREMPPADFSTFVAMLANNVMMFLGQIPDPTSRQPRRDLTQAKHSIDLLLMLREKTQGNLTAEEDELLEGLLPQLQMAYVSVSRQAR
jgi:hypothetical protein